MIRINRLNIILLASIFAFSLTSGAMAQSEKSNADKEKRPVKVNRKSVDGEISGVSKSFIAVVYKKTSDSSQEMPLKIEGRPELQHLSDIRQLNVGDTVSVEYDESVEEGEDGKDIVVDRNAKVIKFISPAPKENVAVEEPEPAAPAAPTQ